MDIESKLLDFITDTATTLGRIETALDKNEEDHKEIKQHIVKLPAIELGLNNHLRSHDTFKRYVMYPVLVGVILTIGGLFCKVILKVF